MSMSRVSPVSTGPVIRRLEGLSPLAPDELALLRDAESSTRMVSAHREIVREGQRVLSGSIILSGWACRVRILADGRRQILGLLLPGDLLGICRHHNPVTATSVTALTNVVLGRAPRPPDPTSGLAEAYARSGVLEEAYLYRQIARLGRFSAYERIIDFLLEVRDRLAMAGLADTDRFPLPMTQEALGDLLGLTSVHVNRTLQVLRREGLVEFTSSMAKLKDVDRLVRIVGYSSPVISFD